jgi:hypothetical protein
MYQFSIVNPRSEFYITFVRNGLQTPTLAAVSSPIQFRNPKEPQFPHWSIGPDPATFRLSWISGHYDDAIVYWGFSNDHLDNIVYAELTSYSRDEMCGAPASGIGWVDPGIIYHALLKQIPPAATISYRFGSLTSGMTDILKFRSPPGPGNEVRLYAYGDMGSGQIDNSLNAFENEQESLTTSLLMASANFTADLVLHIGDISYANGYLSQWE